MRRGLKQLTDDAFLVNLPRASQRLGPAMKNVLAPNFQVY